MQNASAARAWLAMKITGNAVEDQPGSSETTQSTLSR